MVNFMQDISEQTKQEKPETEKTAEKPKEVGGSAGPEPTRYGDWEKGGRCSDF
jgi:hypothetical protein